MKLVQSLIHLGIFFLFLFLSDKELHCSCSNTFSPIRGMVIVTCKNLYYHLGAFITDLSGSQTQFESFVSQWTVHEKVNSSLSGFSICSNWKLLGQPGLLSYGGYFERTYSSLPLHSMIHYVVDFFIIDNWIASDYIELHIDNRPFFRLYPQDKRSVSINYCGDSSQNDLPAFSMGRAIHTGSTLTLKITTQISNGPTNAWFGLNNLIITLSNQTSATEYKCSYGNKVTDRCKCSSQRYLNPANLSECLPCHSNCIDCYGPLDSQCYYCKAPANYDGIRCRDPGAPNCTFYDFISNRCSQCKSGYFLDWNGTCNKTCAPPYVVQTIAGLENCITPCQTNNTFMLWNNRCAQVCEFPLIKRLEGHGKFCDYPCNTNEYLYSNGSCLTSCSFFPRLFEGNKFCDSCPNDSFLYPNGTCLPLCISPRIPKDLNAYKSCLSPCKTEMEYYHKKDSKCKTDCNYPNRIDDKIFCVLNLSDNAISVLTTLSTVSESAGNARSITNTIAKLVSYSNPFAIFFGSVGDMIMFLRYLKINYPPQLQYMLDQTQSEGMLQRILSIPEIVESCFVKQELPDQFKKYDIHSSFFVNFWQPYLNLLRIGGVVIVICLLTCSFKKLNCIYSFLLGVKQALKWNFLISSFIGYFGDLAFYLYLDVSAVQFNSFWSILSFVIAVITNILAFALFIKMFIICKEIVSAQALDSSHPISRRLHVVKTKWKDYEVVFENFKDNALIRQTYLLLFMVRIYIFNIILTSLFDHPLIQAILITLINSSMVIYLVFIRPFKKTKNLIENIVQESALLIVTIIVLILALFDCFSYEGHDIREVSGDIILGMNTGFSVLGSLYLNVQFVLSIKAFFSNVRRKRKLKETNTIIKAHNFGKEESKEEIHFHSTQNDFQKSTESINSLVLPRVRNRRSMKSHRSSEKETKNKNEQVELVDNLATRKDSHLKTYRLPRNGLRNLKNPKNSILDNGLQFN